MRSSLTGLVLVRPCRNTPEQPVPPIGLSGVPPGALLNNRSCDRDRAAASRRIRCPGRAPQPPAVRSVPVTFRSTPERTPRLSFRETQMLPACTASVRINHLYCPSFSTVYKRISDGCLQAYRALGAAAYGSRKKNSTRWFNFSVIFIMISLKPP